MHHSKRANGTEKSHRLRQVLINGQHVVDHASLRSPGFFLEGAVVLVPI
jgi:hypothetical protein